MSEPEYRDVLAEQREMMDLLSQETRHLVIQVILGHPDHLPSFAELKAIIPKSIPAIQRAIERLRDAGLIEKYVVEDPNNPNERDYPTEFYGPTEGGIRILHEYNYLRAVPVLRPLYRQVPKSETVERHESADRPDLPEPVERALSYDSEAEREKKEEASEGRTETADEDQTEYRLFDGKSVTGDDDGGSGDSDSPISELFE